MYSVVQLQALDYLLKRIVSDDSNALYKKNLKFVIEVHSILWYGDFIRSNGFTASQLFIDDNGDIVSDGFKPNSGISPLKQIWDAYTAMTTPRLFWSNPLVRMKDLPLLFETLLKVLKDTEITSETSTPFHPYLLDAKSLNGQQLPFINLSDQPIKLVSIIELPI